MAQDTAWMGRLRAKLEELFGIDRRSLALFRIGLGVMLIADVIKRSITLRAHYTADGVLPREAVLPIEPDSGFFQLFMLSDAMAVQTALFVAMGLLGLLVAVGYRTRLVTVAAFFFLVSVQRRNPTVCHTGDALLTALTFWSMFLPMGRHLSLDRLRGRVPELPRTVFTVGSAALFLQMAFFYVAAGIFKHREDLWMSGEALTVFFHIQEYVTPLGAAFAPYDGLNRCLTYYTLFLECLGPLLLFSPLWTPVVRTVMVILFASFHVGIQLSVYIGIFEVLSVVGVLSFLPAWFWDSALVRVPVPAGLRRTGASWAAGWRRLLAPRAGAVGGAHPEPRASATWASIPVQGLAAACALLMMGSNVNSWAGRATRLPEPFHSLARQTNLIQRWTIFTSLTKKFQGWYLVVGQLADGTIVDMTRERPFEGIEPPHNWAGSYPNHNTRRFWLTMSDTRNDWVRPYLARWLGRRWEERDGRPLAHLAIFQVGGYPSRDAGNLLLGLINYRFDAYRPGGAHADEAAELGAAWQAFLERLGRIPIAPR